MKKDRHRHIFISWPFLCGILFTFSFLTALDPQKAITQYKQNTWQKERGLEQTSVVSICQSKDGYIWLGTLGGLVRFDGLSFKTFNKENTKGLRDNNIRALFGDRQGNLWIGTEEGGVTRLKNGKFNIYPLQKHQDLQNIFAFLEDREGTLWIGSKSSGLICFKNGKFSTYTAKDGLASKEVRALQEDEAGRLWIGTSKGLSIRGLSGKISIYRGKNGPFEKHILSMCRTKNKELWLGCMDGLYRLKDNTFHHFGKPHPNPEIACLYEDSHQNLWVGTDGNGLLRVKNDGLEVFPIGSGLASAGIYAIYEDREKNLWLGSAGEGLHRLQETLFTPYTVREGLIHDNVNCIHKDGDGSLWIGTAHGISQLKSGKLSSKWGGNEGLSSNNVTAILKDSNETLWIGTKAGLNRLKDKKLEHIRYHNVDHDSEILQLGEDRKGTVWILTKTHLFQFHKGTFTERTNKEIGIKNTLVCFFIDRENALWLGASGGGAYRLKKGKWTHYTTMEDLVHDKVEYFFEDKVGDLYIGTRGGLSLWDDGKFKNYTIHDGLLDNFIYFILGDDLEHLWLAGRTGISCISKKELSDFTNGKIDKISPVLFDESDGMKSAFCTDCIKSRDGRLWFATDKGLAMVDPIGIKKNTLPPLIVMNKLIVDGEAFQIGNHLPQYREAPSMKIPPGKKRLEFFYSGLSFVKSKQIKYKYKLEGYDKHWVDAGSSRSTTYTGISPDQYTFRIKACNSDGVWNKTGASLSFYLEPYFWQTLWFYISAALFVLLMVFSLYRLRIRQLKTRQKELSTLVELRTKEVKDKNLLLEEQSEKLKEMDQMKSRFFANISHEFRTPLTLLLGPLEQMIADCGENKIEEKRKLTLMLRNAQRLLRLITQLLELSKLDSGKMKLDIQKTDIIAFIKGIADSFDFMAQQKELELVFQSEAKNGDTILDIDPRKMEDIMSNLLINAFKFTPPGGEVRVTVKIIPATDAGSSKESHGYVEISVCDTGPGIPAEQLPRVFDRFYQADSTYEYQQKGSGIGLALCKELVELHHGSIEAANRDDGGSRFTIRFPLPIEEKPSSDSPKTKPSGVDRITGEIPTLKTLIDEEKNGENNHSDMEFEPDAEPEEEEKNIILVVEDSADMREYIQGALGPEYVVEEAINGKEGIQKALDIIPDLIISDIMMPDADGYELCRTLKTDVQTSHIPIILLTAKAAEENILEGLEAGADDYITKPFSTKILSVRIKNLIDIRGQLQQNIHREMTLQPVKTSVSAIDREFLKDLQAVIRENLSEPEFNVEEMCKKLYMSNTTLYRKIQALCGQTPTEFIRACRLKRARELLKNGAASVTEVAFEVGFSSRTYFTKCFKEKFHQLPSTFQESLKH